MAGLLSQAKAQTVTPPQVAQPPMGPVTDKPAAENPQVAELLNDAISDIYSKERLPKLKQLFQDGGVMGFPKSMGIAVNEGLAGIPEDVPDEILSEVGVRLFETVAEDIIESGVLDTGYDTEGITPQLLVEAAKESLMMWSERNPGRFNEAEFIEAWKAELASEGGMDAIIQGQKAPDFRPGELGAGQVPANMTRTPEQEARELQQIEGGGLLRGGR